MLMTEEQIERAVESKMNSLDRQLMNNKLSQSEYDKEVKKLDAWAKEEYRTMSKAK